MLTLDCRVGLDAGKPVVCLMRLLRDEPVNIDATCSIFTSLSRVRYFIADFTSGQFGLSNMRYNSSTYARDKPEVVHLMEGFNEEKSLGGSSAIPLDYAEIMIRFGHWFC